MSEKTIELVLRDCIKNDVAINNLGKDISCVAKALKKHIRHTSGSVIALCVLGLLTTSMIGDLNKKISSLEKELHKTQERELDEAVVEEK